jgi:hypothetical protein
MGWHWITPPRPRSRRRRGTTGRSTGKTLLGAGRSGVRTCALNGRCRALPGATPRHAGLRAATTAPSTARHLLPIERAFRARGHLDSGGPEDTALALIERARDADNPGARAEHLGKAVAKLSSLPLAPPPDAAAAAGERAAAQRAARTRACLWAEVVRVRRRGVGCLRAALQCKGACDSPPPSQICARRAPRPAPHAPTPPKQRLPGRRAWTASCAMPRPLSCMRLGAPPWTGR